MKTSITHVLLPITVFCCLIVPLSPNAQSLYHDAIQLSDLIRHRTSPGLDYTFSKPDSLFQKISEGKDVRLQLTYNKTNIAWPKNGAFEKPGLYEISGLSVGDSLILRVGNVLDTIISDDKAVIQHNPTNIRWNTLTKSNGSLTNDGAVIPKEALMKEIKILGAHSQFLQNKPETFGISDLDKAYEDNPYLQEYISPLIASDLPFVNSPDWGGDPFNDSTKAYLNTYYDWQNVLYERDSVGSPERVTFELIKKTATQQVSASTKELRLVSEANYAQQGNLGGLVNQGALLVGLSDFIEENAQEELNIHFLSGLKKNLNKLPELQVLFPNTLSLFTQFEISNYRVLLENAQPAFAHDLEELPLNLPELLELEKYKDLNYSPEVYNLVLFYKMANLAYQELTIDTILLKGFEEVNNRYLDFSDKVDSELGKDLWLNHQTHLKTYGEKVKNYHELLDTSRIKLDSIKIALDNEINILKTVIDASHNKDTVFYLKTDPVLQESMHLIEHHSSKNIPYFYIKDPSIPGPKMGTFDYYDKVLDPHLNGKAFYDYDRNAPTIAVYDKLFSSQPTSSNLVARGITLSRGLTEGSDAHKLKLWQTYLLDRILKTKDIAEQVWSRILHQGKTRRAIRLVNDKRVTLDSTLAYEFNLMGTSDHPDTLFLKNSIEYLRSLLDNNKENRWQNIVFFLQVGIGSNPEQLLEEGTSLFDEIITRAISKIDTINNPFWLELDTLGQWEKTFIQTKLANLDKLIADLKKEAKSIGSLSSNKLNELRTALETLEKGNKQIQSNQYNDLLQSRNNVKHIRKVLEYAIHFLYSFHFEDSTGAKKWLVRDDYQSLLSNDTTRAAFLGLLYQQLNSLDAQPEFSREFVALMSTKLFYSIYEINDLRDTIKFKKANGIKLNFRDFLPVIQAALNLLGDLVTTPYKGTKTLSDSKPILRAVPCMANDAISLYENIYAKKYGNAIYNAMDLFKIILDADYYSQKNNLTEKQKKNRANRQKVLNAIMHYGTFMANVVDAERPEEIKAALRAAALPPGNSRIKREVNFNMSVNSFLGLAVGKEKLENNALGIEKTGTWLGLSVPVGLSLSWGTKKGDAIGFFASILDIGAITAFRLDNKDDNVELFPEIRLENFFAPGLSVFYHIRKSPFSFGISRQFGPRIRKLTDEDGTTLRGDRWFFFAGIDVPIFNLIGGSKKLSEDFNQHSCFR